MLRKFLLALALAPLSAGTAHATTCPAYTYTLTNGTTADASQVMGNFNTILTCANSSLAPLASPSFTGNVAMSGALTVTGAFTTSSTAFVTGFGGTGHGYGAVFWQSSDTAPAPIVFTNAADSIIGYIATTSTSTSYVTSSDRRLKENVTSTARGLDALMKLKVTDFDFISDTKKTRTQGFIAQDLYEAYPEAVAVGGDDPKASPWAVDYGRLTPLLVRAIQDLKAINDGHAKELADLKAQLAALKASPAAH